MKKCKSCHSDIADKAAKCPHCQADQRNWFRRHPIITGILILFVISGIFGAIGSSNKGSSVPAQADTTKGSNETVTNAPTTAPQELLNIAGTGSKSTQKFTAGGDWDLDWTYDCSSFGSQGNFQVYIYNGDGSLSFENSAVNQLGSKGASTEHYHKGGTYYLQVNSECAWTMKVQG